MSTLVNARQRVQAMRLPDGSRSVQSPWVWRGFFFMSLIALGVCLTFVSGGQAGYGAAWAMIQSCGAKAADMRDRKSSRSLCAPLGTSSKSMVTPCSLLAATKAMI